MPKSAKVPKPKKCRVCQIVFVPMNTLQKVCSVTCAISLTKQARINAERREIRTHRVRLKTRREWLQDTQNTFNRYIRTRDAGQPCICCGEYAVGEDWKPGGSYDAGHYLSVGSHPELRFEEDNCFRQMKSCNAGSGRFARKEKTVSRQYRERLIAKIGLERVLWLEGPHPPRKYTIEELQGIKKEYQQKLRELRKQNGV